MARAAREGWALIALDVDVDTSTPAGEMLVSILATFAQFERRLIAQRTRDALQARKAAGVRLGRPVDLPEDIRGRVAKERNEGRSFRAIADGLNRDAVPTARGGTQWWPSTARAVVRSVDLD